MVCSPTPFAWTKTRHPDSTESPARVHGAPKNLLRKSKKGWRYGPTLSAIVPEYPLISCPKHFQTIVPTRFPRRWHVRNQIVFVDQTDLHMVCKPKEGIVQGCWRNSNGDDTSGDSLKSFVKQSVILNEDADGWDTIKTSCSHLQDVVTHEMGHAYGLSHAFGDLVLPPAVSRQFMMRSKHCYPAGVEIAAITANYQSRFSQPPNP